MVLHLPSLGLFSVLAWNPVSLPVDLSISSLSSGFLLRTPRSGARPPAGFAQEEGIYLLRELAPHRSSRGQH